MKILLLGLIVFLTMTTTQSQTKRVLFLGNSYTYVNNLPQMIADVAGSMSDTLIYDSNTPGGQSLYGHYVFEPISINKIKVGNWDFVVLQEQSQAPSLPTMQVNNGVFPYARLLDSIINVYNHPCGKTIFYMTWGRKNGDAINCAAYPLWQYVCTYEGMDSLLNLRYRIMADMNKAVLSPVGAVWHYIRYKFPLIDLYQTDESHPSVAGSYAAACCFYTTIFRKDPTLISFNPGLSVTDIADIKSAVKLIVYDSLLNWHIGEYDSLININCNTSVQNIPNNSVVKIFPNPCSTHTTLQTGNIFKNATLSINNCFGQSVKQIKNINGQVVILSRDNLPSGLYFIRLSEDNKIFTDKLIIIDR